MGHPVPCVQPCRSWPIWNPIKIIIKLDRPIMDPHRPPWTPLGTPIEFFFDPVQRDTFGGGLKYGKDHH